VGLINKVLWKKCVPGKSGLLYGVLLVIMVLEFVVMYIIGMRSLVGTSAGVIVNIANYLVLPRIHLFRMHQLQKNLNNGFISFSESLRSGVSITFIAGLVYGWI
jgi:preprotein translocase subunit YajC